MPLGAGSEKDEQLHSEWRIVQGGWGTETVPVGLVCVRVAWKKPNRVSLYAWPTT